MDDGNRQEFTAWVRYNCESEPLQRELHNRDWDSGGNTRWKQGKRS